MSEITLERQLFEIIKDKEMPENVKLAKLDMLVNLDVDVNAFSRGKTALVWAKEFGENKLFEFLSENGAKEDRIPDREVDRLSDNLMKSIEEKDLEEVKKLIEEGADVNYSRLIVVSRETPIVLASREGYVDIVKELINNGADINGVIEVTKISPIFIAASKGHIECVELLLNHGVDINDRGTQYNLTPLIGAIGDRRDDMIDFLISKGADVNKGDRDGLTPLMYAVDAKNLSAAAKLIAAGADVMKKDNVGKNAIQHTDDEYVKKAIILEVKKHLMSTKQNVADDLRRLESFFSLQK